MAMELSKYKLSIVMLERENDVSLGTTKANSAVLHAGYDPEPGTLMAKLNVEGIRLAKEICRELDVAYWQCGSLLMAFDARDMETLKGIMLRGQRNLVPGLALLGREELLRVEPGINSAAIGALHAPTAAITNPWELTLAMAQCAVENGATLLLEHEVQGIRRIGGGNGGQYGIENDGQYEILTPKGAVRSRFVLNAAGVQAEQIHCMVSAPSFSTIPDRGQYYLLDKSEGNRVRHIVFQCPTQEGKGVLVAPTVHGNLIVGPNNERIGDGGDTATSAAGLAQVARTACKSVPTLNLGESIRNFAGVRAATDTDDFIIAEAHGAPGFIDIAGIKSPGLSAAPAIGKMVAELLGRCGLELERNPSFVAKRKLVRFNKLSVEEKRALIAKNPAYGHVICRCETITEGEILDALRSPIPPRSIDGVKRRVGAGMGRCQGGFCGPQVMEILAREHGIGMDEVVQERPGSYILTGETKNGREQRFVSKQGRQSEETGARRGPHGQPHGYPHGYPHGQPHGCHRAKDGTASDDPAMDGTAKDGIRDLVIVGGGPAGLAAACAAWQSGLRDILIVERGRELGGILNQCIHNGFGLHYFGEELTGPEYASRFIQMLGDTGVRVCLETMALHITDSREIHLASARDGYRIIQAKSIVLAMGCRERPRGAVAIPGTRPAGVLTAGTAQRYVNMEGYMVGRRVVVLGSGDIGLIMARRMTLEGAKVLACVEIMPYSGGLTRNIVQCLRDYDIPLYLSHTITDIRGKDRVEQVVVSKVDENRVPIPGSEMSLDCDTVLLSVGLIPENELTKQAGIAIDPRTNGAVVWEDMRTSLPGVFACGNVVHVHDLVDFVTAESQRAGDAAARFVLEGGRAVAHNTVKIHADGGGISYTVPQYICVDRVEKAADIFFRVSRLFRKCCVYAVSGGQRIARFTRDFLVPGEMSRIRLPRKTLESVSGGIIVLSVEEAG